MIPVRLEALLEGNSAEIPANISLECSTPVVLQNHSCLQGEQKFMKFYRLVSGELQLNDSVDRLEHAGRFLLICGRKLKQVVLDACFHLVDFSKAVQSRKHAVYSYVQEVVNCIQKPSMEGNTDTTRVRDLDSKETPPALPTEIINFYNSTITPNITSTNNGSCLPGIGLNAVNGSFEGPPQIEGPSQSNGTIAYCVGGVGLGLGCLIASMAAIAWKRTMLNEKRRKRYQEMVTSNGGQLVKSSENNSLIPQSAIV